MKSCCAVSHDAVPDTNRMDSNLVTRHHATQRDTKITVRVNISLIVKSNSCVKLSICTCRQFCRGRFGRRVIRLSSGDTLESVRCWHASSSEKQQKLGCFLNQKYFLLSLKCPSFYSFCEEEEECYQSVTRWRADDERITRLKDQPLNVLLKKFF
jgi:hypothetical protein